MLKKLKEFGKNSLMEFTLFIVCFLLFGCDRTFKDSITFNGQVYYGTYVWINVGTEQAERVVTVTGPATGAIVKVADHEEFATCGSDGQYALLIETHRDFMSPKSNLYTIQAFVSRSTTTATDEYTTVYGRPGDTVQVRPLVLLTITDEEKGF